MLHYALCVALLVYSTAGHERGEERVAAAGSDAMSGSAVHSHLLHKHEHERKSVSLTENGAELHERGQERQIESDNLHDDEEHIRGSEMQAEAEDLGEFGCVWDETGAGDPDRMELNCARFTEEECVAADNGNKDGRCVWRAKSHKAGAHKDTITVAGKEQSMAKKVAAEDQLELDDDAQVAPLGCLWDGSGCAHDMCDMEQMSSRCADLSHSKASCLGTMGTERRCFWSHGTADDAMRGAVALKIMGFNVDVDVVADAGARHSANEIADNGINEDQVPQLGCVWDKTGCANECDMEKMASRCAELSHSKASCLGDTGKERRCTWSHGAADEEIKPAEAEVNVVADAGNRHNANEIGQEGITEDQVPQLGCMWDGTGCMNDCDKDKMQARCAELSHSKTSCLGSMGADMRCFWSHGAANDEEFEHFKPAAAVEVVADAGNRHSANEMADDAEVAEDNLPQLGCVWDQTGCANECDMEKMASRCAELSHSKASCLGDTGKERRCTWSHGADDQMAGVLNGGFEDVLSSMKVSTMDLVLGVVFVVTVALALQRLYKWWSDRGYIKLAEKPQDVEPLLMTQV